MLVLFKSSPSDSNVQPKLRTTAVKDVTGVRDGTEYVQRHRTEHVWMMEVFILIRGDPVVSGPAENGEGVSWWEGFGPRPGSSLEDVSNEGTALGRQVNQREPHGGENNLQPISHLFTDFVKQGEQAGTNHVTRILTHWESQRG